jgi:hypothetical protein
MASTHLTTLTNFNLPWGNLLDTSHARPLVTKRIVKKIPVPLYRFSIDVSWQTSLEVELGWYNHCLPD